jgi:hypothetical protein
MKTLSGLPNWSYSIEEISANVYRLKAVDLEGRVIDLTGIDPEELISEFRQNAESINLTRKHRD